MTLRIQDSGTLRTITAAQVKVDGVLRTIREIKVQDGGSLRTVAVFATALAPSISSTTTEHFHPTTFETLGYTVEATASPGGGLGPYTYSWAIISGTGWSFASGAASATVYLSGTAGATAGTARVTVTDSLGQTGTADLPLLS